MCFSDSFCLGLYEIGFVKNCSVIIPWSSVWSSIYFRLYRTYICSSVTICLTSGFSLSLRYASKLYNVCDENTLVVNFATISPSNPSSFSVHVTNFCNTFCTPSSSNILCDTFASTVFNWFVRLKMIRSMMLSPFIAHNCLYTLMSLLPMGSSLRAIRCFYRWF